MQNSRNLALGASALVLTLSSVATSLGAVATWSEEMTSLPNVAHPGRWGAFDDASGNWAQAGVIELIGTVADPMEPAVGVWKIPQDTEGLTDKGMAVLDGMTKPGRPSPTAGYLDYTVEVRYQKRTTFVDGDIPVEFPEETLSPFGGFTAFPFALDVSSGTTPGIKFKDGYRSAPAVTNEDLYTYFEGQSNEVTESVFQHPAPGDFPSSARDVWHKVRITQSFTNTDGLSGALNQKVYLDGNLLMEFDRPETTPLGHRSIWIRQEGSGNVGGGDFSLFDMTLQELWLDYIRVAEGIVPIDEPILAPGSVVFDAADFNQDGTVGTADFNAWATNFGLASGATKAQGDADSDGNVDGGDFLMWQEQYGRGVASFLAVPEPATALSVALMLGTLVTRRRRV